ncbi:MAG: CBS domain-containing protein [Fimbriimonadaceae bacterium]
MQLESISANAPIREVATKMKATNVGLLLVADKRRLLGVVTDRDIVIRAFAEGKCPGKTCARDIMSHPVVCIDGGAELEEAAKLMIEKKVRRLVVTNDDRQPVGVLSLDDIAFSTHGDDTAAGVLEEIAQAPQSSALFRTV